MSTKVRVGLYARISDDELGLERGVRGQMDDVRAYAERQGWEIVLAESDNDVSASKGAPRAGYDRVMGAARAGRIARIVVFHTSRLWRNRRERADGIGVLSEAGVSIAAVKGPELHLDSAYGRGMAEVAGAFDTMESEVKAERVARAARQRATEGRANGAVLYGWTREYDQDDRGRITGFRDVEDPAAATVVREITERLLSGESLKAVTDDLNARGIRPPGAGHQRARHAKTNPDGALWGKTSVKKLAMRPANVGLRVWHRGRPDEELIPASWPPIVERSAWEQLRSMLADPDRNSVTSRPGARHHLLTWGVGECGVCGGHLRVAWKGNRLHGSKALLYLCAERGCVGRNEQAVDDLVGRVIVARLARDDAADLLAGDDTAYRAALARGAELRARLDVAADEYAEGKITARQLERITARLQRDIAAVDEDASRHRPSTAPSLFAELVSGNAEKAWDRANLTQRRAILEAVGLTVRVLPVRRRGPGFDPETIEFRWQQGESS